MKQTKHSHSHPPPAVVYGWIQLREWTQTVDRKLALILDALKTPIGSDEVIPELEKAVNRSSVLSKQIDRKVPDEQQQQKE